METVERQLQTSTTRRTVVATGVKLAYAAPLVAASFQLGARGTLAVGGTPPPPTDCFHSIGGLTGGGCMAACTQSGCTGDACDGFGDPDGPCTELCLQVGGDNPCLCPELCDPDFFVCVNGVAVFNNGQGCP